MIIYRSTCCGKMLSNRCQNCPVWWAREEAINRVTWNTDPTWSVEAFHSADRVMRLHRTFTADDIWLDLEARRVPEPHERRAMGGITRSLVKSGEVKIIDRVPSVRPVCHGRMVSVYQVMW